MKKKNERDHHEEEEARHEGRRSIAEEEFKATLAKLKTITEVDLAKLDKTLETVGAPWTAGRVPVWQDK